MTQTAAAHRAQDFSAALLKRQDVTALANISRSHLYERMASGRFPLPTIREGRLVRWARRDVLDWLASPSTYGVAQQALQAVAA